MLEIKDNAFYTLDDVHEGTGITLFSLRNWIKSGQLKATKTGVRYFVKGKDLRLFLETGTAGTSTADTPKKKRKK